MIDAAELERRLRAASRTQDRTNPEVVRLSRDDLANDLTGDEQAVLDAIVKDAGGSIEQKKHRSGGLRPSRKVARLYYRVFYVLPVKWFEG